MTSIIDLPCHKNDKGNLTVIENHLPFKVNRIYWTYNADNQVRGGHRHLVTRQALIAINGSITINIDNGFKKSSLLLDDPTKCLIVEPEDWHTMYFEKNAILLVLASHHYNKDDYVNLPLRKK